MKEKKKITKDLSKYAPGAAILFAFSINSAANEVVDMVLDAIFLDVV